MDVVLIRLPWARIFGPDYVVALPEQKAPVFRPGMSQRGGWNGSTVQYQTQIIAIFCHIDQIGVKFVDAVSIAAKEA